MANQNSLMKKTLVPLTTFLLFSQHDLKALMSIPLNQDWCNLLGYWEPTISVLRNVIVNNVIDILNEVAFLKVDLELPTDWHVPILWIIFPLENPHCREKRYMEYSNVSLNLFSQCNLWRNITFNDNRIFILRITPVLQLGIFLHNRYALLLRMETLATE